MIVQVELERIKDPLVRSLTEEAIARGFEVGYVQCVGYPAIRIHNTWFPVLDAFRGGWLAGPTTTTII